MLQGSGFWGFLAEDAVPNVICFVAEIGIQKSQFFSDLFVGFAGIRCAETRIRSHLNVCACEKHDCDSNSLSSKS